MDPENHDAGMSTPRRGGIVARQSPVGASNQPEIGLIFSELATNIEQLDKEIASLEDKLSPILSSSTPEKDNSGRPEFASPFANGLAEKVEQIRRITNNVRNLRHRTQI